MARLARVHFVSLKSSLINLPISIYGPLLERQVRPQNLAVHLTRGNKNEGVIEAYVGWTGMASASSLANFGGVGDGGERGLETIEMDPQFANALGFNQGDVVEIGLLHDLPLAKSISTEPLSTDDWEIIEIHATHVENTLLSQVRIAKVGQEIDVWVLGRTRVRLMVVGVDSGSGKGGEGRGMLLGTDTEVSIAPKLRRTGKPGSTSNSLTTSRPKQSLPSQILRVIPPFVLPPVPPSSCSHHRLEVLAYVSHRVYTELTRSSSTRTQGYFYRASIKRLKPPSDPLGLGNDSKSPLPKFLSAGGGENKEAQGEDDGVKWVYIGPMEGIPEKHILFPGGGIGDVQNWDLVRILVTNDRESSVRLLLSPTPSLRTLVRDESSSTISVLAGVDDILKKSIDFCLRSYVLHASTNVVLGMSGLLITGRPGAGKTSIAQAVARSLQDDSRTYTYTLYVDMARYSEQPISTIKALLKYWLEKSLWHRPTVLIMDNMEKLVGAEVEHADSFRARHITELFLALYSASAKSNAPNTRGIILIGIAQSQATLHTLISSAHIFSEVINLKSPNKDARRDILRKIVQKRLVLAPDIQSDPESPINFTALATQTEGYSAMDLQDLVARAVHHAAIRSGEDGIMTLRGADFDTAQIDFVPHSLRDVKLEKSDVEWSDIGGLSETRRILRETLEWPTKYGPIFAQSPLRLRSGLLLYGFPGCGKTLLASAVAKECGLNFISIKGPEILNKYIGASEKSVRDLFERASAAKPCVLFFDEFDSIAPKRGHDSTGVTDRVVNQMLTQMDGAEGLDGVYVLAATSRPDLIDSALLRPGRLDKSLLCDMPDLHDRKDILKAVSRKVTVEASIDWGAIAELTEGYSGADLQALVYNAHLEVIHSSILPSTMVDKNTSDGQSINYTSFGGPEVGKTLSRAEESAIQRRLRQIITTPNKSQMTAQVGFNLPKEHVITEANIRQVLKSTQPSVSEEERARLCRIYRAFVSDRSGNLPVPSPGEGVGTRASLM